MVRRDPKWTQMEQNLSKTEPNVEVYVAFHRKVDTRVMLLKLRTLAAPKYDKLKIRGQYTTKNGATHTV